METKSQKSIFKNPERKNSRLFVFILIALFILVLFSLSVYYLVSHSKDFRSKFLKIETRKVNFPSFNFSSSTCQPVLVYKVIDGDTIQIKNNSKIETVRLLGINTPEVENPYRHAECFGKEASKETKKLLLGKKVFLIPDPNAPDKDKYSRLLRYVFLKDGLFVNAYLIKEGYAYAYIFKNEPIQFASYFKWLQSQAKASHLGLWEVCNE